MRLETLEGLSETRCELAGPLVSVTRSARQHVAATARSRLTSRPLVPQDAPVELRCKAGSSGACRGAGKLLSSAVTRVLTRGLWGRVDSHGALQLPRRRLCPCVPVSVCAAIGNRLRRAGLVPASSLHYFLCLGYTIVSGTWNCSKYILQTPIFKFFARLSFKKAAFPFCEQVS